MPEVMIEKILNMTKEQIIEEASINTLDKKEIEAFDKGNEFIEKMNSLDNKESERRVVISLIAYRYLKKNGGMKHE